MPPKRVTPPPVPDTELPTAGPLSDRVLHILSEAAALFAERGYDGASMRDLAERCGVSKSLLYHHFADKEEIYTRITLGFMQELHDHVAAQLSAGGSVRDRVGVFMTATAQFFERYRLVWTTSTQAFWTDPAIRRDDERLRWRRKYEALLRDLLAEGVDSGELAALDVNMAGRLILSAMNWLPRWYKPGGAQTAEGIAATYHRMIFDGLAANPVTDPPPRNGVRAGRSPPGR